MLTFEVNGFNVKREYYTQFQGRSEKEIQLATAKLNQTKRNHAKNYKIRAKQLGHFLSSVEGEEVLLQQRLQDERVQEVFRVIDGGLPNLTPYRQLPDKVIDISATEIPQDTEEIIIPEEIEEKMEVKPSKLRIFKTY